MNIDSVAYRLVASDPFEPLPSNFSVYGSRRVVPLMVWALPFPDEIGFEALTVLGLTATVIFLWRLLAAVADPSRAVLGVTLFVACPATTAVLRNPQLVDAPLYACMAGAAYSAVLRRWWLAAFFLALAPLIKEPGWLLVPTAGAIAVATRDRRAVAPLITAVFIAAAGVGLLYHTGAVLPVAGAAPLTEFDYHMDEIRKYATLPNAFASAVLLSWGPVWVSALLGLMRTRSRVLIGLATLIPLVAAGMPATSEWIRLLSLAFPAVLAATCALLWRSTLYMAAFAGTYVALMFFGRGPVLYGPTRTELFMAAIGSGICILQAARPIAWTFLHAREHQRPALPPR